MAVETCPTINGCRGQLSYRKNKIQILKIDASENRDIWQLIEVLLYTLEPGW